jgi:hypothetical protein
MQPLEAVLNPEAVPREEAPSAPALVVVVL